ncbi:MAG: hypothetical protein ACR2N9_03805 [Acidimicrobiia bacterium]
MTTVFAVVLAIGLILLVTWIVLVAVASMVDGAASADPERWAGVVGRIVIAYLVGFGLAGMAAAYGGWADLAAIVGAVVGGLALVGVAVWLGPRTDD